MHTKNRVESWAKTPLILSSFIGALTDYRMSSCVFSCVCVFFFCFFFFSKHLFYVVWRTGTRSILTSHDGRHLFSLSGIRTCDHPHASPEFYHRAMGADICFYVYSIHIFHQSNFIWAANREQISCHCPEAKHRHLRPWRRLLILNLD